MTSLFTTDKKLILASASPRRKNFLSGLGLPFRALAADLDETPYQDEPPEKFVRRMAREKAMAIACHHPGAVILGADTVIDCRGQILGKPSDADQALAMLQLLRETGTHRVITGFSLVCLHEQIDLTQSSATTIHFASLPDAVLQAYVDSGEPMGKAGAYAIQEKGGFLVRKISGSSTNVIGLPMCELVELLLEKEIISPGPGNEPSPP
jgi:septum formation protein